MRWTAVACLLLLAGCAAPRNGVPSLAADAQDAASAPPLQPLFINGTIQASACLFVPLEVLPPGMLDDKQAVPEAAWNRTYSTSVAATAAAINGPLCLSWLAADGHELREGRKHAVPVGTVAVLVQAEGSYETTYTIEIK